MNDRIKEVRKSQKLTQEKFGEKLGVTKTAISKMELGTYSVTDTMIRLIASTFNVNEEWIRTGNGDMFTPHDIDEDLALALGQLSSVKNDKLKESLLLLTELTDDQLICIANMVKALKDDNK